MKPGNGRIEAAFSKVSESGEAITALSAVNLYCEKADAAATTCVATDLSAPTGTRIVPDAMFDATYRCGSVIGASAAVVDTSPESALANGLQHARCIAINGHADDRNDARRLRLDRASPPPPCAPKSVIARRAPLSSLFLERYRRGSGPRR